MPAVKHKSRSRQRSKRHKPVHMGQHVILAVQHSTDDHLAGTIEHRVKHGDTITKIAARHGRPDLAHRIAHLNHIRSVTRKLHPGSKIKLPASMKAGESLSVLCQDAAPPYVTDGYAIYQIASRPGRIGINQLTGFNPLTLVVPADLLAVGHQHSSADVEDDCTLLARMAGRGHFPGAGHGPPAVLKVTCHNTAGHMVPLISHDLQALRWVIGGGQSSGGLDWDPNPWRDRSGKRTRQLCTVTLSQYVPIVQQARSPAGRTGHRHHRG